MLVYNATKQQFIDDVRANLITDAIENEVARRLNRNSPRQVGGGHQPAGGTDEALDDDTVRIAQLDVSRNSAPREVFKKKLTGTRKKTHIDNLFKGSGSDVNAEPNAFHVTSMPRTPRPESTSRPLLELKRRPSD